MTKDFCESGGVDGAGGAGRISSPLEARLTAASGGGADYQPVSLTSNLDEPFTIQGDSADVEDDDKYNEQHQI